MSSAGGASVSLCQGVVVQEKSEQIHCRPFTRGEKRKEINIFLMFLPFPERVYPNPLCRIAAQCPHGWNCLPKMSGSKLKNWAKKEWLHRKLVRIKKNERSVAFFYTNFPISGIILRDSHGVAQVRFVNGNKILRIMKAVGLKPDIPEDLYFLIKKAVSIRKHLERNRKDIDSKFRLILVESRIHRLARYYKIRGVLPPTWKYESSTASALVA